MSHLHTWLLRLREKLPTLGEKLPTLGEKLPTLGEKLPTLGEKLLRLGGVLRLGEEELLRPGEDFTITPAVSVYKARESLPPPIHRCSVLKSP